MCHKLSYLYDIKIATFIKNILIIYVISMECDRAVVFLPYLFACGTDVYVMAW